MLGDSVRANQDDGEGLPIAHLTKWSLKHLPWNNELLALSRVPYEHYLTLSCDLVSLVGLASFCGWRNWGSERFAHGDQVSKWRARIQTRPASPHSAIRGLFHKIPEREDLDTWGSHLSGSGLVMEEVELLSWCWPQAYAEAEGAVTGEPDLQTAARCILGPAHSLQWVLDLPLVTVPAPSTKRTWPEEPPGTYNLGGKEGQCQVTEVGLSWAYSRKSKENPVAGADVTETSVKDEHRGNVILDVMAG